MDLSNLIKRHTIARTNRKSSQYDLIFFGVDIIGEPSAEEFKAAIKNHEGSFTAFDPLDGEDRSYIDLGAWVGDQGAALQMMALGTHLGIWQLVTPLTIFGRIGISDEQAVELAGGGLVCIRPI